MIRRIPWSQWAADRLGHEAGADCIDILAAEVRRGIAKLWHAQDGAHECLFITRVDCFPDGRAKELVICYAQGTGIHCFAPQFLAAATAARIPIRVHTTSLFMVRYLRRWGLQMQEYVLRRAA